MAHLESSTPTEVKRERHPLEQLLLYAGSAALLAIMLVETVSVLGRHLSLPLVGAIEIVQSSIIVVACTSTVIATLQAAHARVQLIINRLSTPLRTHLSRLSAVLSALFFLGLAAGSIWLAHDAWHAFEESEVLHISYRPLRAIVALSALITTLIFITNAIRPRGEKR